MAEDWTNLSPGTHNVYCSPIFNFLTITTFYTTASEDLIFAVYRFLQLLFMKFLSEGNIYSDPSRNVFSHTKNVSLITN